MSGDVPRVVLLAGDGIGPEVAAEAVRVLEASGFGARYEERPIGWEMWRSAGEALPAETLEAVRGADAALLGAVTSKPEREALAELDPSLRALVGERGLRYRSPVVRLRRELDLYAGLRPARSAGVDILTVRESTECLYAGVEIERLDGVGAWPAGDERLAPWRGVGAVAASVRVISARACERIARVAFREAARRGEGRVTLVEKPNILRATGAVFVDAARRMEREFDGVALEVENIDAACMHAVLDPGRYGVVLASNMFGDIFSDLAAGLTGGPGLAPSAAIGDGHAVFEPVHGSAPDIAGRGIANPIAAIRSGAMLARHLGDGAAAGRIERAVERVLARGEVRTADLGGCATTHELADAVLGAMERDDETTTEPGGVRAGTDTLTGRTA